MKSFFVVASAVVVGLILGIGSALMVLNNGELLGRTEYDHWFGNEDAGSIAADPYTRGIIARIGLLALNRTETIYFHRYVDDHGDDLREECVYELSGGDLPARWWSITVYAADDFLPVNGDGALSVDATRIARVSGSRWTAMLSAERRDAPNWISTRAAGRFNLALRMYNPTEAARNDPSMIPYPSVKRVACAEDRQ